MTVRSEETTRAQLLRELRALLDTVEPENAALPAHLARPFAIVAERLRVWLDDPSRLQDVDQLRDIIERVTRHRKVVAALLAEEDARTRHRR